MFTGWGNADGWAVMLYVGEGPRGSNGACSTLHWISVFPSTAHNQIDPLWFWFPSGWACALSRSLWISPTTSPMRLGVSPAAAPTTAGIFSQRFGALFPHTGALGYRVCFVPPPLVPVYLCAKVGPWGATCRTACPILCHSESGSLGLSVRECRAAGSASGQTAWPVRPTLCQSQSRSATATRVLSAPAACLHPSYWSG